MLPAEGSRYRRKLRKVLFNSGWIASEIGMVAKSAIAVSRDFAHRTDHSAYMQQQQRAEQQIADLKDELK